MISDTHPQIEALQIEGLRRMTAARKLELVDGLNRMARRLALEGLRRRFPEADEEELRFRLACLLYGDELAGKAYGQPVTPDASQAKPGE